MAIVPTSAPSGGTPTVQPDGIMGYQSVHADASMFGGAEGQALQGLGAQMDRAGGVLAQHALHLQDLANEAAATQADTIASARVDDYLFNPKVGLFAKRGADAVTAWGEGGEQITGDIQKIYGDVAGSLANDDQRRQFDRRWQRTSSQALQTAARHVASENRVYLDTTQQARAEQAINNAALNWNDTNIFGQSILSIREAANEQARIQGQGLDYANQKTQEYVDKAWTARLRSMANTDAPGAQALLEQSVAREVKATIIAPDGRPVEITVPGISGLAAAQVRADLYHKATQQTATTIAQRALTPFLAPQPVTDDTGSATYAIRVAGTEGTGQNPDSSAFGTGQFIDSTWKTMIGRYRPDLTAGKSDADILALRADPALGQEMTQRYAAENAGRLRAAGLPVTAGTLYLSHFLGPGDALKVLRADPATPLAGLVQPASIDANPKILAGKTAGDVIAWTADRMKGVSLAPPQPPPTQAQILSRNAGAILDRVRAMAGGDPELEAQAVNAANQQINATVQAQSRMDGANYNLVTAAAYPPGGGGPQSLAALRADPRVSAAYDSLIASQPDLARHFDGIVTANSQGKTVIDTPANLDEYQRLLGLSNTDPEAFKKLRFAQWATPGKADDGSERPALTPGQIHTLMARYDSLVAPDTQSKTKLNFINQALSNANVATMLEEARIGKSWDAKKYARFVGAFDTAIDAQRAANDGRDPTSDDLRKITTDLLQKVMLPGTIFDKTTQAYLLDPGQAAGATFTPPPDFVPQATIELTRSLGRPPTPAEIGKLYQMHLAQTRGIGR